MMNKALKQLEFVAFCIEEYAGRDEISGTQVTERFERCGVLDYLFANYEASRTQITNRILPLIDELITEITQKNVRLLLPAKIARAVAMLARERQCSHKEALLEFYRSDLYRELEREETKCWWASPLQLFQAITAD